MMALDPPARRRILAALALAERPGSDGERAAAEAAIGRLVVTHADAIRRLLGDAEPEADAIGWRDLAAKCLRRHQEITDWELGFVRNLLDFRRISPKQHARLIEIAARLAMAEAA
jgi:hypothetical protein